MELYQSWKLMRKILFSLSFLLVQSHFFGQEHFDSAMAQNGKSGDSVSTVKGLFDASAWHFHSRSFFMNTLNQGLLKDDFALAQGAGIGLVTKPFKGFQMGLSGYFIFNVWSSNLNEKDPTTQSLNRYEIGQFDVLDRTNRHNLDRLEDLYFRYTHKFLTITLGRMTLETPFVNMQDGRMRPTLEEGVWFHQNGINKKWKFQGGVIWGISPRSTVDWFKLRESIGPYGWGVNTEGNRVHVEIEDPARVLVMVNPEIEITPHFKLSYWNAFFENVMNTSLIEGRYTKDFGRHELYFNSMWVHQNAVGNGGNENQAISYIQKGAQSNVLSTQLGLKDIKYNWNLNYTHILNGDRYLMPREWGRDPFYTFMSRERNEGMANVHAFTSQVTLTNSNGLKWGGGLGYYRLPSISNFVQNKYGMPSYGQMNLFASYSFKGAWEGLNLRFLVSGKTEMTKEKIPLKNQINKVNMINTNFVLDFHI
jgi:hypothetical protein